MAERQYHLDFLDGLRGYASLWVVIGHAMVFSGYKYGIFAQPDLAVELFIIISGFLMTWHYQARETREPWDAVATWKIFWTRRYFRIAPLYYLCLAVALILGPMLWIDRIDSGLAVGVPESETLRYINRYLDQSMTNVLMHISFIFGATWTHNFRTALPDWSIGLEMQYYAVFPFLMLAIRRFGAIIALVLLVTLFGLAGEWLDDNGFVVGAYSMLPMKFHVFAAGMMIASSLRTRPANRIYYWWIACAFLFVPLGGVRTDLDHVVKIGIVSGFFLFIYSGVLPGFVGTCLKPLDWMLTNRFSRWVGDLSYGVYLIHLLVMLPVSGWLARTQPDLATFPRFWLCLLITAPITYGLAWIVFRWIETPGIVLGRRISAKYA